MDEDRKIHALLREYGHSHQNFVNKAIHWICVPMIIFSLVGLLLSTHMIHGIIGAGGLFAMSVALFFLAWIGQFVGHKIERAKLSFFDDLRFLLVGPA